MTNPEGQIFMVSLSGLPGVGKSSVLRKMAKTQTLERAIVKRSGTYAGNVVVRYVFEPSHAWEERGWLTQFYSDPTRYAFAFQLGVFDTHVDAVVKALEDVPADTQTTILVVERSMYDQLLFWEVNKFLQGIDGMQDQVYQEMWKKWKHIRGYPKALSLIVFLKTDNIDDTMERVKDRARNGELKGITREYQQALFDKHLEWFTDNVAYPMHGPAEGIMCMHVDANRPYHADDEHAQHLINEIASAIVVQVLMNK